MKKLQLYACLLILMASNITIAQNPFTTIIQSNEYQETISDQDIQTRDQVVLDDLIVDGSACIGQDCVNGEAFGFNTIKLKENNLRIGFVDTSNSASFPSNDWEITINDTSNGGANFFGITDIDGGRRVFSVEAGAPANALYVDDGGRLGLGTATPVTDIHTKSGDTPTLRLEQDGSSGFTPQSFDIASNETNFFVRDATNGSTLPFRIRSGAPTSSIDISASGSIGIETQSPNANASLDLGSTTKGLQLNRMDNAGRTALGTALGAGEVGVVVFDTEDNIMYTWDGTTWNAGGTDDQALSINVNSLELEDGGSVDLAGYLDNTDDQALSLNVNSLDLEDGGSVDLAGYLDNTDDQALTLNVNSLDLEDGGSVDLAGYLDNTDDQALSLNVNSLDLEDGGSVDLSGYLDNTDEQDISGSGFAGNTLTIGIENGSSETVDLSSLDDSGTDDQQLSLSGNDLDLEDGGSVSLASYLDNTDDQNMSGSNLTGNILTVGIENGTSETVDLSSLNNSGTDDQQLSLSGNNLELEDGGSVDLSGYIDNTDDQNLANFNLSAGSLLSLSIENGNVVSVNLAPLLDELSGLVTDLQSQNADQQAQIDDLILRMEIREECACDPTLGLGDNTLQPDRAYLLQNIPNPFDNTTSIGYFVPFSNTSANVVISTMAGQIVDNISVSRLGVGSISVNKAQMASATYLYTLYVDNKRVDTKRMIVE
jgi:hypothetical protein